MSVASSSSPGDPVTDRLRAVRLFAHLTEPELVRIAEAARERHYPRNSVILFTDDPGDALYIVLQGEVKVVLVGEDGREVILTILGAGEFFGEMALIDDQPRSAHVIATTDATLLVLRRDDFHRCLEESPRIALGLLRELSRRLRHADDTIGGLVLLEVNGRVARLLLELAGEHGGTDIPRTVTQHTIAQMVGSSRETVSRTLREFQDQRLIGMTKDRIQLLDRPRLARLAGLP
jgi:CRP/FNR family cyclic AMP-dependent transcriptional regulator